MAIFIGLIVIDGMNQRNDLIPFHAIAGIIITLVTLGLCNYGLSLIAWVLAIGPGLFLIVTTLYSISKSTLFITTKKSIGDLFNATGDTISYLSDEALSRVESINKYGQTTYKETGKAISSAGTSIGDSWNSLFNAKVATGMDPAKAAVQTTAEVGAPVAGTAADNTAKVALATSPSVTITGEYTYLCGNGIDARSVPPASMAESCKYVNQQCTGSTDPKCRDKLIGVVSVPAVCLGMLATGGAAPSYAARDNCLACNDAYDSKSTTYTADLAKCRCEAMGNCPTATPVGSSETVSTQPFMNYGSW